MNRTNTQLQRSLRHDSTEWHTRAGHHPAAGKGEGAARPGHPHPEPRADIWANRLPSGDLAYNVTFDRLYREANQTDGQGEVTKTGEWKQSQSFGKDDLLLLAKLADQAHSEVYYRLQDECASRPSDVLLSPWTTAA